LFWAKAMTRVTVEPAGTSSPSPGLTSMTEPCAEPDYWGRAGEAGAKVLLS
jgi:hypothetical protein